MKVCSAQHGSCLWNAGRSANGRQTVSELKLATVIGSLLHRALQNEAVALLVFACETHANFVWIFLAMIFNFSKINYLGHYFDVHSKV